MDERAALTMLADRLTTAGDDAAVINEHLLTIDMLHATTDFPTGVSEYTVGWRTVGASLSDIAAMGGQPVAAVGVYGRPSFEAQALEAFVDGAADVCVSVNAEYVGGDLDHHDEPTTVAAVLGSTEDTAGPIRRTGASPGDRVCVTGTLGRSAAGLALFEADEHDRANDLFRFSPRVTAGRTLATHATAMIDSSDGLARSVHQIATASGCGINIRADHLPIDPTVDAIAETDEQRREFGLFFGEDFELVCTVPPDRVAELKAKTSVTVTDIGEVTTEGVTIDGDPLPDRGYDHGTA